MSEEAATAVRRPFRQAELKAPAATAFLAPPLAAWRRLMIGLIALGLAHTLFGLHLRGLTEIFFYAQDLPVAGLMLALLMGLYLVKASWAPAWRPAPGWRAGALVAFGVVAVAWAGTWLVYDNYALSLDEFMARFDAQILATGRLEAPVPPEWRPYVTALQPQFMTYAAGDAFWYSGYLPVNAAFLALASRLGAQSLMPPLWAGIAVLATFGVGRRLWPDKSASALAAALLLATAPQLLITAMTPYAMSAHLALNMVWLWLVLRGGKAGHGAAAGVAFLATGLHQIVFHPLFAAPFVLELWLARRWKPALWHTAAFTAIGGFWMLFPALHLASLGAPSVGAAAASGYGMIPRLLGFLAGFDPVGLGIMAKNLVRFATWQSLLTLPLATLALLPALRAGGMPRATALGVVLTLVAMLILLPYQGHGWGYRYLHGLMGSICLLAAWSWTRITERPAAPATPAAVFAAAAAASLLILLPLRAWQTHAFEHPYAVAERQIQATDADVVLVDDTGVPFGVDLVRNDPFLRRRPVVIEVNSLSTEHLMNVCQRSANWIRPADAAGGGIGRVPIVGVPARRDCAVVRPNRPLPRR